MSELIEKLQDLNPSYVASHGTIGEIVSIGERSVGIQVMATVLSSLRKGDPIGWSFPTDGMPAELNVASISKASKNIDSAKTFVNYMISKEGQQMVSSNLGYIPVRIDMDYKFENGVTLADINLISRDVVWINQNKQNIINKFREITD